MIISQHPPRIVIQTPKNDLGTAVVQLAEDRRYVIQEATQQGVIRMCSGWHSCR